MLYVVPNVNQFNITLSPELKKRLQELADQFKMGKASKVGAKIIEMYTEEWAALEIDKQQMEDEYKRELADRVRKGLGRRKHPPLEQSLQPARRKKTR